MNPLRFETIQVMSYALGLGFVFYYFRGLIKMFVGRIVEKANEPSRPARR